MAQTIPDLIVTQEWQSITVLSAAAGVTVPVGTEMDLQFKSMTGHIYVSEGTEPPYGSTQGRMITTIERSMRSEARSDEQWVRTNEGEKLLHVMLAK